MNAPADGARPHRPVVHVLYLVTAAAFFLYLLNYYLTTLGGPTLLAFTLVPITFVLFTLDALRKDELYPSLGPVPNYIIAAVYCAFSITVSVYMYVEFEALGTVRAGIWDPSDLWLGGLMALLVMEYARKRYFVLFVLNIILILYAVYGRAVPGLFHHPGLSWKRVVASMSLEDTTGIFSSLPQLALTLIGSFVLVLAVLRAFGVVDSILRGASRIAVRSRYALPQAAVVGSMGVAAVSGSGAANAVTTGSATIPALINAGMTREDAASVETSASLGGQLMPPIMGISAFLMAEFLDRSYFDVVARGYAPALVYFIAVALGVYLMSHRQRGLKTVVTAEPMGRGDWARIGAFLGVVAGLIGLMSLLHLAPIFAALYVFAGDRDRAAPHGGGDRLPRPRRRRRSGPGLDPAALRRHLRLDDRRSHSPPGDPVDPYRRLRHYRCPAQGRLHPRRGGVHQPPGDGRRGLPVRGPARHGPAARADLHPDRARHRAADDQGRGGPVAGALLRVLPGGVGGADAAHLGGGGGHVEDRAGFVHRHPGARDRALFEPLRADGGGVRAARRSCSNRGSPSLPPPVWCSPPPSA